jgi:hypothetical protein
MECFSFTLITGSHYGKIPRPTYFDTIQDAYFKFSGAIIGCSIRIHHRAMVRGWTWQYNIFCWTEIQNIVQKKSCNTRWIARRPSYSTSAQCNKIRTTGPSNWSRLPRSSRIKESERDVIVNLLWSPKIAAANTWPSVCNCHRLLKPFARTARMGFDPRPLSYLIRPKSKTSKQNFPQTRGWAAGKSGIRGFRWSRINPRC